MSVPLTLREAGVIATLARMGKKKPTANDRHKPRRLVGIPERVCAALEQMGVDREATLTEMVKAGLIYFLEKHDRWPPPAPKPAGK